MTGAEFFDLVFRLTGTPVKECTDREKHLLDSMLADDGRAIDYSQFNEILLLVNKDRMGRLLFERIFSGSPTVASIRDAVQRFQIIAMLRYGNFVYAYRTLCRFSEKEAFDDELSDVPIDGPTTEYDARTEPLLRITLVPRSDTPLIGYLSAATITAESIRGRLLLDTLEHGPAGTWQEFEDAAREMISEREWPSIEAMIKRYVGGNEKASPSQFREYLHEVVPKLEDRYKRVLEVQRSGSENQDIYLTWDHMDVYFATSMRKAWEYLDLYDFVEGIMAVRELQRLKVRHFDPTQSYANQRIDKGLVESLMLKRAKCTVYSVQDTDTLGKDSELAATLAQGKPVIAYVPTIDLNARINELIGEDPVTILDRLRFVIYADDAIGSLPPGDLAFLDNLGWLTEFERRRIFRSFANEEHTQVFREQYATEIRRISAIIGASEQRIYDSRYRTLRERHPLGIQVNLDTGVANGVLVVRDVGTCSDLLTRILNQTMEFTIDEDEAAWYLRERISGCVFRVVTKNLKVSNCFWNFYLRS